MRHIHHMKVDKQKTFGYADLLCNMSSQEVDAISTAHSISITDTANMATLINNAVPNASPFLLKVQDVEVLAQSDGFNILRAHLAQHYRYE